MFVFFCMFNLCFLLHEMATVFLVFANFSQSNQLMQMILQGVYKFAYYY